MFGKSKKNEAGTKKGFNELVAELNEAMSSQEVSKGFIESIDQFAALKELKARITGKMNEVKEVVKVEYHNQGLSENVKHSGVTVGFALSTTVETDLDKYDAAKVYKKFPEAMKISISSSYIKTMMKDEKKAEVLGAMGISLGEKRTFKVT